MIRTFSCLLLLCSGFAHAQDEDLRKNLESTYQSWRLSLQNRNDAAWKRVTAEHRQVIAKNRILSEKRKYPAAIFELPAMPPPITGLKHLGTLRKGPTAKSYYYGRIDFGLGGNPEENLLVLSYVGAASSWRFDQVEYISLAALPEIRKQLASGDIQYIKSTPELLPSGEVPSVPVEVKEAPYIAKVYVYCPTREVRVAVNKTSQHLFTSTQAAELVIGGAQHGKNEIQYTIKTLEAEDMLTPLTIRVYLMSQVAGVKPVMIFEHLVKEGEKPKGFGTAEFIVDEKVRRRLMGGQ